MSPLFDYRFRPSSEQACVVLLADHKHKSLDEIAALLAIAGAEHGFGLHFGTLRNPGSRSSELVRHGILFADAARHPDLLPAYALLLDSLDTLSVAYEYGEDVSPDDLRAYIDEAKVALHGRVNFIRPDQCLGRRWQVSAGKIVENAVCDSVRVKYVPLHKEGEVSRRSLYPQVVDGFRHAAGLYAKYKMYHRAPSDGYFAMRGDGGFFITATKTNKTEIDLERISFVHDYDELTGSLSYSGKFLPSSDAVECYVAFTRLPHVNVLVHTHASDLFTRNPRYQHLVSVPALPYGEPALGHRLAEELQRTTAGHLIMEDHGEVFALSYVREFESSIVAMMENTRSPP